MVWIKKITNIGYSKGLVLPSEVIKKLGIVDNDHLVIRITDDNKMLIERWIDNESESN